jgi:hypothetical protein
MPPVVPCTQCTWVWDDASDKWEPVTVCAKGCNCLQTDPNNPTIPGEDGDILIALCVPSQTIPPPPSKP